MEPRLNGVWPQTGLQAVQRNGIWSLACSEPVRSQRRTSSEQASVMEFGFNMLRYLLTDFLINSCSFKQNTDYAIITTRRLFVKPKNADKQTCMENSQQKKIWDKSGVLQFVVPCFPFHHSSVHGRCLWRLIIYRGLRDTHRCFSWRPSEDICAPNQQADELNPGLEMRQHLSFFDNTILLSTHMPMLCCVICYWRLSLSRYYY